MRLLFGLSLLLCGCQILPHKESLCAVDPRCEPVVPSAFVLGKPDGQSNPYTTGMGKPGAIAISNTGALYVIDSIEGRILVWNSFPSRNNQPADFALNTDNHSLPTPVYSQFVAGEKLPFPWQVSASGDRLIVTNNQISAAPANNYAYFYAPPPTKNGRATYFWSVYSDTVTAKNFRAGGPLIVGNQFFLVDREYHRLLIWNSVPADGAITDASGVFGQMDFLSSAANGGASPSSSTLNKPQGVPASDGTRLLVADTENHRVLLWNTLPTDKTSLASFALGQDLFTQSGANRGQPVPSAKSLRTPTAVAAAGDQTAVADTGNHRVLIWNKSVTSMGQAADVVLGQADFASNDNHATTPGANTLNAPSGIASDGSRLAVSDTENHRVLIWTSIPTRSGQPADLVLGQPTLSTNSVRGGAPTEADFVAPVAVARSGKQYVVVDQEGNRVLIYPAPPVSPLDRPSLVLDELKLVTAQGKSRLKKPSSASSDGTLFAVADTDNHRVLIWNSIPTRPNQPADVILGQPKDSDTSPNAGTTDLGLNTPTGVYVADGKIYVADSGNHRVLIWNTIPTQNHKKADVVLGQADWNGVSPNRGGGQPSNATLNSPKAVITDGRSIYVSDSDANRVVVYSTLTPHNGQAADLVLGQDSFDTQAAGSASAKSLNKPIGLSIYGSKLYVSDSGYHRIVRYEVSSLVNGVSAERVIGQPVLDAGNPNSGGLSLEGLYAPNGILVSESGVYIADRNNGRVLALPPPS